MTSPTPAERTAIRTGYAALLNSKSPNSQIVEQVVYALGAAGLLMDPETAAEIECTVRQRISADIDVAIARNLTEYPDEAGMRIRRLGMRAAQRLVDSDLFKRHACVAGPQTVQAASNSPVCPVCHKAPSGCTCFGKTHVFEAEYQGESDAKRRLARCRHCQRPRTDACHADDRPSASVEFTKLPNGDVLTHTYPAGEPA